MGDNALKGDPVVGKREIGEVLRARLARVVRDSGFSRGAFAARVGLDRSTLSQLLSAENVRLPRAETLAAIAAHAQVSVDWLLGLSQEGQIGADVLQDTVSVETGGASPSDARLRAWHAEAIGYKIRYVPASLPDLLKTEEVIRYGSRGRADARPEVRIEQAEARLAYTRRPESDMEVCSPLQSLEGFARGEGTWRGLAARARRAQLETIAALLDELYPTLRWFLFDGLRCYSAPFTVFGPQRVAIYLGDMYLVSRSTEHIRALTRHFDELIRAAVMQPRELVEYVVRLARDVR